jgi:hypothetical protein
VSGAEEFFGGAASLSWSLPTPDGEYVDNPALLGVIRGGRIEAVGDRQQMLEFRTNKPLYWEEPTAANPEGRKKYKIVITLRCDGSETANGKPARDERDRANPADDGVRDLHVGSSLEQKEAIKSALRSAGLRKPRIGDLLFLAWTGKRPSKGGGRPARLWAAVYVRDDAAAEAARQGQSTQQAPGPVSTPTAGAVANPFGGVDQQGVPATPAATLAPASATTGVPDNPFGGPLPDAQPAAVVNPFG